MFEPKNIYINWNIYLLTNLVLMNTVYDKIEILKMVNEKYQENHTSNKNTANILERVCVVRN